MNERYPAGLSSLARCLRIYVQQNPGRFRVAEEVRGSVVLRTVHPAKERTNGNESRLLR